MKKNLSKCVISLIEWHDVSKHDSRTFYFSPCSRSSQYVKHIEENFSVNDCQKDDDMRCGELES